MSFPRRGCPPVIRRLEAGRERPRFSVMIPTHEPDERLVTTLESVLRQAPAADAMQIAVVDDGSRPGLVRRLVEAVDPTGRVELGEFPGRLGIGGNWNRAVTLARGTLVHLLHQDDHVLPGFYARMDRIFTRTPDLGMAFCRSRIVDGSGRLIKSTPRLRWLTGVLHDWLPRIAMRQRVQTPAAVVSRATYESLGGYREDLVQALDWEMWVRIAARFRVGFEPRALAVYHRHDANTTSRLFASGLVWPDIAQAIEINAASLPASLRDRLVASSGLWHSRSALRTVERQIASGSPAAAAATLAQVPLLVRLIGSPRMRAGLEHRCGRLRARLDRLPEGGQTPRGTRAA